jgi:hypothetical protein
MGVAVGERYTRGGAHLRGAVGSACRPVESDPDGRDQHRLEAALVFNELFFPSFEPLVGTLLAFATYAVGFVARPLGGIVFGHYGGQGRA